MERPGPWRHRYVAANGARFHLACTGPDDGPAVVLLHGFPQLWWAWRGPLVALGEHGHRTLAMDLRGYGGSDKTPRGYDPLTLARDVAGVVQAVGARSAVVVGHGWGGYVAWVAAAAHPEQVRALAAVAAPHPTVLLGSPWSRPLLPLWRHVLAAQPPMLPERRLADPSSGVLRRHLEAWSATPGHPTQEEVAVYTEAMGHWPAPHCALEYHRWLFRSRWRSDGRAVRRVLRAPLRQPVLTVAGARDPAVPPLSSAAHVAGPLTEVALDAGHFVPEEAPGATAAALLGWLGSLPAELQRVQVPVSTSVVEAMPRAAGSETWEAVSA